MKKELRVYFNTLSYIHECFCRICSDSDIIFECINMILFSESNHLRYNFDQLFSFSILKFSSLVNFTYIKYYNQLKENRIIYLSFIYLQNYSFD